MGQAEPSPANIVISSSQRARMLYENYRLRELCRVRHLFTSKELLEVEGQGLVR